MRGRDPHESHRVSTPLELFFDLTFATAFGLAATQYSEILAGGQFRAAFLGFGFASFAICWAWVNFTWFASAYDTDDWIFRLATMVQMIGVLVVAMGLPRMFASARAGVHLDNSVMVAGYVIMRVALVSQWLRAARQDPRRRRACLTYATAISVAQIGWIAQLLADLSLGVAMALAGLFLIVEISGPVMAERKDGGTPWNAHHIAERYSCFAIIALGEGVVGTVAAVSAAVGRLGWTLDAALVCVAGVGLTFGMWWVYFLLPSADALTAQRGRAFAWGFGQIVLIVSIVAGGAGLREAAQFIEGTTAIGPSGVVLAVAIPIAAFIGSIYALYSFLVHRFVIRQLWLLFATLAVLACAVVSSAFGANVALCIAILVFAPMVTILGHEVGGRQQESG